VEEAGGMPMNRDEWLRSQIEKEGYWFLEIDLGNGIVTPGWSNPKQEKLPQFGLPDDMSGMRVLDIGCAEGFFSFEAERRGAREVIAIDAFPESIRRFNICRTALDSSVNGVLASVYDVDRARFGTFDLVMFFGVLYHLRHPLLALEKVAAVTAGTLLLQTRTFKAPALANEPVARFYPNGVQSGPPGAPIHDPSVFWEPNETCVREMLLHVGFSNIERLIRGESQLNDSPPMTAKQRLSKRLHSPPDVGVGSAVFRAQAGVIGIGVPPEPDFDGGLTGAPKL
jgi:tRNA (mo5U34)-methyltransferase